MQDSPDGPVSDFAGRYASGLAITGMTSICGQAAALNVDDTIHRIYCSFRLISAGLIKLFCGLLHLITG
jgi:hypothetical protein